MTSIHKLFEPYVNSGWNYSFGYTSNRGLYCDAWYGYPKTGDWKNTVERIVIIEFGENCIEKVLESIKYEDRTRTKINSHTENNF